MFNKYLINIVCIFFWRKIVIEKCVMFFNMELFERKGLLMWKCKISEFEKNYRENLLLSF